MKDIQTLMQSLQSNHAELIQSAVINFSELTVETTVDHLIALCDKLKNEYQFEQLTDICGVDYSAYGESDWNTQETTSSGFSRGVDRNAYKDNNKIEHRFAVCYQLLSLKHNIRLRIRVRLDDSDLRIPSVISIWSSADWYEREAFDLFGFLFEGHPDLRRILTDYGFIGHPMRKDFPLEGQVEVRYDPDQQRVIYQPVTITNRVLVPKVIRHDNRYVDTQTQEPES